MINFLTQIIPAKFKKKVFLSNNSLLPVVPVVNDYWNNVYTLILTVASNSEIYFNKFPWELIMKIRCTFSNFRQFLSFLKINFISLFFN